MPPTRAMSAKMMPKTRESCVTWQITSSQLAKGTVICVPTGMVMTDHSAASGKSR